MDWTPGRRLSRLPKIFWPLGLFARNLYYGYLRRPTSWEQHVYRTLEASLAYVHTAAVPGDIAEFGTMTGRTARVLARSLAAQPVDTVPGPPRRLLLFDSFEGLPEASSPVDKDSIHVADGTWVRGTCKGLTPAELARVARRYLASSRVQVIVGWFADTVAALPERSQFAVVHVDCDLYQSTMDVLDSLFARQFIAAGAVLLFDDWLCNRASPHHGEQRAWTELTQKYRIEYRDMGPYGAASWRFLVLGYQGVSYE